MKRQHTRVKYFQGSLMNAMDLERAKVSSIASLGAPMVVAAAAAMTAHPRERKKNQCRHLHFLKKRREPPFFYVVLHLLTRIFAAFLRFFS